MKEALIASLAAALISMAPVLRRPSNFRRSMMGVLWLKLLGRQMAVSPSSPDADHDQIRKQLAEALVEQLAEWRKSVQDETILFLIYEALLTHMDIDADSFEPDIALAAARVFQEDEQQIAGLAAPTDPRNLLRNGSRRADLAAVQDDLWRMMAACSLMDPRLPAAAPTEDQITAHVQELKARPGMFSVIETMAKQQQEALKKQVKEFEEEGVGVIEDASYEPTSALYTELNGIFQQILLAAGQDPRLFTLTLLDHSEQTAFVMPEIPTRVFFDLQFLKAGLEGQKEGLLDRDWVAAILAHEVSHLVLEWKQKALSGKLPPGTGTGLSTRHAQEDYADFLAVKLLDRAGYNAYALAEFFDKQSRNPRHPADLILHPATESRYRAQLRHLSGFPYRTRRAKRTPLDARAQETLRNFEGTFSRFPREAAAQATIKILDQTVSEMVSRTLGPSQTVTRDRLHRKLRDVSQLMDEFRQWLEVPHSYGLWRRAWDSRWPNKTTRSSSDPVEVFTGLKKLTDFLCQHRPAAGDDETERLLEQARSRLDDVEETMDRIARGFNARGSWLEYYFSVFFETGQMPTDHPWVVASDQDLRRRLLESPRRLGRAIASGELAGELVGDWLIRERADILQRVSPQFYWDLLLQTIERPVNMGSSRFPPSRTVSLLEGAADRLQTAQTDEARRILAVVRRLAECAENEPPAEQKIFNDRLPELARACAGNPEPAVGRMFRAWIWSLPPSCNKPVKELLKGFSPDDRKESLLAAFQTADGVRALVYDPETPQGLDPASFRYKHEAGESLEALLDDLGLAADRDFVTALIQSVPTMPRALHHIQALSMVFYLTDMLFRVRQRQFGLETDFDALPPSVDSEQSRRLSDCLVDFFEQGGILNIPELHRALRQVGNDEDLERIQVSFRLHRDAILYRWRWFAQQGFSRTFESDYLWGAHELAVSLERLSRQTGTRQANFPQATLFLPNIFSDSFQLVYPAAFQHRGDHLMAWMLQNDKVLMGPELEAVFPFLMTDESYDQIAARLMDVLPACPYRDYALYIAFAHKRLGVPLEEVFSSRAVSGALSHLPADDRFTSLCQLFSHLGEDRELKGALTYWSLGSLMRQEAGVLSAADEDVHRHAVEDFPSGAYAENPVDRSESQLDLFLLAAYEKAGLREDLFCEHLSPDEQLSRILTLFSRPSGARDVHLAELAERVAAGQEPNADRAERLRQIAENMAGHQPKDRCLLLALDRATAAIREEHPGESGHTERVRRIGRAMVDHFPKPSLLRDDLLDSFIEDEVETAWEYRDIAPLYSTAYRSEGRSLDTLADRGEAIDRRNYARILFQKIPLKSEKIKVLLWMLGFSPKPDMVKRLELDFRTRFDYVTEFDWSAGLSCYSGVGRSAQRELIQELLWDDETGIFTKVYQDTPNWQPPAEWHTLLGALFDGIFADRPRPAIYRKIWDTCFTVAPRHSWVITENIMTNLLTSLSQAQRQGAGPIDDEEMLVLILASSGVAGMKLGQILHSFGYLSQGFAAKMEKLKYASPVPLSKREVLASLEYYGLDDLRVMEKAGEGSISPTYRVIDRGRVLAMKFKKPAADEEARAGLAIIEEGLDRLKGSFNLPAWLVPFLRKSVAPELDFSLEAENASRLRRKASGWMSPWEYARLFATLYHLGFRPGEIWRRSCAFRSGRAWEISVVAPFQKRDIPDILFEDFVSDAVLLSHADLDRCTGAVESLAGLFLRLLVRRLYHADLHEGNIMLAEPGRGRRAWILDTGSVGELTRRELRNAVGLLRALRDQNPALARRHLTALYQSLGSDQPLDELIARSFQQPDALQRALWLLREVEGLPADRLLQLTRAMTAAGFILRRLGLASTKPAQASGAVVVAEAVSGPDEQPLETLTLAELVDGVRDRLDYRCAGEILNRVWGKPLQEGDREILSEIPEVALENMVTRQDRSMADRGLALKLGIWRINKLGESESRLVLINPDGYENPLGRIGTELLQIFASGQWHAWQPSETDKMDYLYGLLWNAQKQGTRAPLNLEDVNHLQRIASDPNYPVEARNSSALILIQASIPRQMFSGAADRATAAAGEACAALAEGLAARGKKIDPVEEYFLNQLQYELSRILRDYGKKMPDFLYEPRFSAYLSGRLNDCFARKGLTPAFRRKVLRLSRILMTEKFWESHGGEPAWDEFITTVVWGRASLNSRFNRLWDFVSEDWEKPVELLHTLWFIDKFIAPLNRGIALGEPEGIVPPWLARIPFIVERRDVFQKLTEACSYPIEWYAHPHPADLALNIYFNLWGVCSVEGGEAVADAGASRLMPLLKAPDSKPPVSKPIRWRRSIRERMPSLAEYEGMVPVKPQFVRLVQQLNQDLAIGEDGKRSSAGSLILRREGNRREVVDVFAAALGDVFSDPKQDTRGSRLPDVIEGRYGPEDPQRGRWPEVSLLNYLHLAASDSEARPATERVFRSLETSILNPDVPEKSRNKLLELLKRCDGIRPGGTDNNAADPLRDLTVASALGPDVIPQWFAEEIERHGGFLPGIIDLGTDGVNFYRALLNYACQRPVILRSAAFQKDLGNLHEFLHQQDQGESDLGVLVQQMLGEPGSGTIPPPPGAPGAPAHDLRSAA